MYDAVKFVWPDDAGEDAIKVLCELPSIPY